MSYTLQLSKEDVIDLASALTNQRVHGRRVNQSRRNALTQLLEASSGLSLGSVVLNALKPKRVKLSEALATDGPKVACTEAAESEEAVVTMKDAVTAPGEKCQHPGEAALDAASLAAAADDARAEAAASPGKTARRRVGLLGCGDIALSYVASLRRSGMEVVVVFDFDAARAAKVADACAAPSSTSSSASVHPIPGVFLGSSPFPRPRIASSFEEFLADPALAIVVNLTPPARHFATTQQALMSGKHVWSEKPLASTPQEARTLVALAAAKQLELGCSPMTCFGEAARTLAANLPRLGAVRLATVDVHCGSWAPLEWRLGGWQACPRQGVGSTVDVGVYPLSLLTALLGPVSQVTAHAAGSPPLKQQELQVQNSLSDTNRSADSTAPTDGAAAGSEASAAAVDVVSVHLRFRSGATANLTSSLSLSSPRPRPLVLFGDGGVLALGKGAGLVPEAASIPATSSPAPPAATTTSPKAAGDVAAAATSAASSTTTTTATTASAVAAASTSSAKESKSGADVWDFDAPVTFCDAAGKVRKLLPPVGVPTRRHAPHPHACDWARGVLSLADSVDDEARTRAAVAETVAAFDGSHSSSDGAPHGSSGDAAGSVSGHDSARRSHLRRRFTGAHALHLVEVMDAIARSAQSEATVRLPPPSPSGPQDGNNASVDDGDNNRTAESEIHKSEVAAATSTLPRFDGPLLRAHQHQQQQQPPTSSGKGAQFSGTVLKGPFPGLTAAEIASRPLASRLVLGTMKLASCANPSALLDAALALGVNVFDVAPIYGSGGGAESAVGKWLDTKLAEAAQQRNDADFVASFDHQEENHGSTSGGSSVVVVNMNSSTDIDNDEDEDSRHRAHNSSFFRRQDIYLVGKACHPARDQRPRLNASALAEDVASSLRRLKGATYLDLLLLHRDDPSVPVEEVATMVHQEALQPGFALAWGTSNWSPTRLTALMQACRVLGVPPPVADAPQFSLAQPSREVWSGTTCCTRAHAATLAQEHLALFGWAPLAAGYLTQGAANNSSCDGSSSGGSNGVNSSGNSSNSEGPFDTAANQARRARAMSWGQKRGMTLEQVSIAWALQCFAGAFPAFVSLGTGDPAHLADLAAATSVRLTRKDVHYMMDGSPLKE